jgi:probable H4MPT-linked C1 transfer pathway protein
VVIGWDIGGAHLKAARIEAGRPVAAILRPSPLWQGLDGLERAFAEAKAALTAEEAEVHAVTMTGELADLFPSRREGVRALAAFAARTLSAPLFFYAGARGFLPPAALAGEEHAVASANWHASARWAALSFGEGLFVDIGSTTTDIIPLTGGKVAARGRDDASRMAAGELVYTGIARSFVLALAQRVPLGGQWVPLMGEYFASAADVHRLLGTLPEGADVLPSADGREKSVAASEARLARMLGRDAEDLGSAALRELARYLAECQLRTLHDAAAQVLSAVPLPPAAPLIGAGVGRTLLPALAARLGRPCRALFAESACADHAPAVAVALLLAKDLAGEGESLSPLPSETSSIPDAEEPP